MSSPSRIRAMSICSPTDTNSSNPPSLRELLRHNAKHPVTEPESVTLSPIAATTPVER